jgi:hypothetical protein
MDLCREAARELTPERFDAAFDARHHAMLASRTRVGGATELSAITALFETAQTSKGCDVRPAREIVEIFSPLLPKVSRVKVTK